ncbi:hypothetical protein CDIK_3968 [Cucumispora dikerogammari]|nr:hypothetical protein CDIK_3968 [Cucumispora dikerogammari]
MVFQKSPFRSNQPKVLATENVNLSEASSGNEPLIVFEDESPFLPSDIDYFKNDARNTDPIKKDRIVQKKKHDSLVTYLSIRQNMVIENTISRKLFSRQKKKSLIIFTKRVS